MSDWNLFVREARPGNFRGNRSLAMRSLSRGARSKHCRLESGSKHGRGTPAQTAKPTMIPLPADSRGSRTPCIRWGCRHPRKGEVSREHVPYHCPLTSIGKFGYA